MAQSEVSLVNLALTQIGEEPIVALSDRSKQGRAANRHYETIRDAVLRAHAWNAATKRTTLATLATAPVFGFSNAFALPVDCLRVLAIEENFLPWVVEQRTILSDDSSLSIKYIFRLTDVSKFDELLKQSVAARLAAELVMVLKGSPQQQRELLQNYEIKLTEARFIDQLEGPTDLTITGDSWTRTHAGDQGPFRKISPTV